MPTMTTTATIDDTDLIKAAKEALTRPSDFGYYGDLDMFISWGFTIAQHRDSGPTDRSNYRCIIRDLDQLIEERGCDPDDYRETVCSNHWAVGWCDQLAVRVLIDEDGDITPENITGAFRWIASTALYLHEQDSVYDSSDYSDLEYEEALEIVSQTLADIRNDAENAVDDEVEDARLVPEWVTAEMVVTELFDSGVETPRENHDRYDETVTAVWRLVDDGPPEDDGPLTD